MSDATLKPCPFCGGEAIAITGPVKTLWGATCIRCSCWLDDRAPTSAEAITAWNTRADAAEIAKLQARIEELESRIAEKQRSYDELYADALADAKSDAQDFDSELWRMVRGYLDELHFDWRDFMEDGVTADEAVSYIRECMNEETRRADDSETALAALQARIAALVEAAERQDKRRAEAFARRHMNAPEDPHVYVLCERYGYGAVMDAASRLWARNDSMGAFYIGGCIGIEPRAAIEAARGE